MPKPKHFHRYIKTKHGLRTGPDGKKTKEPYYVYRCILDNCSHFISEDLVLYRKALCFYCTNIIEITPPIKQLMKPHCGCLNKDDRVEKIDLDEILSKTLGVKIS